MTMLSLLDIPQVRVVPTSVLSGLREIDSTITMVHLSEDRWVVCYLSGQGHHIARGRRILENTRRAVGALEAKHAYPKYRAWLRRHDRLVTARLKALGAIGLRVYQARNPDGRIVEEVRANHFYHEHTTEPQFWQQVDALEAKAEADRIADLTDPARANDVWRNMFTLSHTPGIRTTASLPTPQSSGHTLIRKIA